MLDPLRTFAVKRVTALAFAAGLVFSSGSAHAIERQHHLGLAPAFGMLTVANKSTLSVGGGGAIHYAYGLTDQWNLSVEASSVIVAANQKQDFATAPRNRPATVDHLGLGLGYVIDILRWVPYLNAHGGLYRVAGGTLPDPLWIPGVSLGLGLDYQINRHFAVGVALREHFMLTKLDDYASYTTGLLRFEYMWGY